MDSVVLRAGVMALFVAAVMMSPWHQKAAEDDCSVPPKDGCFFQPKTDLLFMIDASGSIANRGQTYNIEIDGVVRALRDPAVIPRDGSIAVSVLVFNGGATLVVSLTDINSPDDAEAIAHQVEALKCGNIQSQIPPCPFGDTKYSFAIQTADIDANKARILNPKPGARRVMVLSSDGQPDDIEQAIDAANKARVAATIIGVTFEFDVLLVGLNSLTADLQPNPDYESARAAVDQLVFPQPADNLPGATLTIEAGPCNQQGANSLSEDCQRQSRDFAARVRSILRPGVSPQSIVVGTEADTPAGAVTNGPLSLRQAIEAANCNGGATNITLDGGLKGKTINLLSPLSITQPDVVIDGCDGPDCAPSITLDGAGKISDGIVIRSHNVTVRGLKISNFTRSGILSTAVCPSDYISHNLIEKVSFENNPSAVLVLDEKTAPREFFNEQIKISRINATRAAQPADAPEVALIDLGGDGPTANDAGDTDEGPNTLLNFPDSISVVSGEDNTVTITGQVSGPAVQGALVEIYSITKSHLLDGKLVIDGVAFLAQATVGTCAITAAGTSCTFSAAGIAPSPTGNYTATVIDSLGNTSELMFRADGKPAVGPSATFTTPVDFGPANFNSTPLKKNIDITNDGNAPLQITKCSIARCDPKDPDDTARFTISGCPEAGTFIDPGETITVVVTFATNICGPAKACLFLESNDLLHSPIVVTLTGSVSGNAAPVLALQGSLEFGPVNARDTRRKPKKFRKLVSHAFTVTNNGCSSLTLTFQSIKRITDVAKCKITDANADDSELWVVTQLNINTNVQTVIPIGPNSTVPIAPGEILAFRVGFNPAVPAVVNKNCPDGNLSAEDVLPDEVSSALSIRSSGVGSTPATLTVPLTGKVNKDLRLIDPANPSNAPVVKLCRNGNEFTVEFSVYDPNLNVDRANYQFMDSAGRIVGQTFDVALTQAIASRNLAKGQSFTVSQKFTGASDNSQIVSVQVRVFDADGSTDGATANQISTGCSSVQTAPPVLLRSSATSRRH
ncbi:MAG: VWA domain-containing protein [Acidobacteriota bacterium]